MTFCTKCGENVAEGVKFCTGCGNPMTAATPATPVTPAFQQSAPPPPPRQPAPAPAPAVAPAPTYAPAPAYAPLDGRSAVVGTWSWIGTFILLAIPLVGLVFCIVWAFGGGVNLNRRNLARACLILTVVGIVVSILLSVMMGAAFSSILGPYMQQFGGLDGLMQQISGAR
ncbi:MAG: zinc ribbon domain-containing protein [Acidobacteriota bacterium]|jgi:hypothetical protein|nr:zinc ribbon domain-containing protein [Acidobacteriota bacterium]